MTEVSVDRAVLLLRVAAASTIGGLAGVAAASLTHTWTRPWAINALVVTIAVICVAGTAALPLRSGMARAHHVAHEQVPPTTSRPPHHGGLPVAMPQPPVRPQPNAYPAPPPSRQPSPAGLSWHEAAARGVAGRLDAPSPRSESPAPTASGIEPKPPGPSHLQIPLTKEPEQPRMSRQIVQCPRCGGFEVQVREARRGYAFACRSCGHPWHWQSGAPWPITVIRPKLAHQGSDAVDPARPVWRMKS